MEKIRTPELKKAAYNALQIFNGGCNPMPLVKQLTEVVQAGSKVVGYCNYDVIKTEPEYAPARLIMVQLSHLFFGEVPGCVIKTEEDIKICEEMAAELEAEFRAKYPTVGVTR